MSISVGLYDIFSNTVPGLLYIFVIFEFLRAVQIKVINIPNTPTIIETVGLLVGAFVIGHIFNAFTYKGWYRLFSRQEYDDQKAIDWLKRVYPEPEIGYQAKDSAIILTTLQLVNKDATDRFEQARVNAIMMRNISLGLFLLGVTEIISFLFAPSDFLFLIAAFICIVLSFTTKKQTARYYQWFYRDVFKAAMVYGNSLEEFLKNIRSSYFQNTAKQSRKKEK